MTFLPIVERELRVGARKRFTFWSRVSAAALAVVIFGAMQILVHVSKGMFSAAGEVQFGILKWLSFAFVCATGLFLTSDSLSEEKREGTLGLLFLTDLKGYDVVLGKLISHAVQAFYGLLAAFPVLALTLLSGGVSGGEFWRMMLILCNTLFFSISLGLAVSSISRDAMKAMNGTLLAGLLFMAGAPLADLALAGWDPTRFAPMLSAASPGYLFVTAGAYWPRHNWAYLGIQHALSWSFLVVCAICTPRAWQEKATVGSAQGTSLSSWWRFGSRRARIALRRKLLDKNPLIWLALRDRWLPRLVWAVILLSAVLLGWSVLTFGTVKPLQAAYGLHFVLWAGLVLWMALQACRWFVEANRNGAMELILVTPLNPQQIVRSQWAALWRTFLIPAVFLVLVRLASGIESILEMQMKIGSYKGSVSSGASFSGSFSFNFVHYQLVALIVGLVVSVANLIAVGWFGMWMGLTSRKVPTAMVKTIGFVVVLPWLAIMFVQGIVMAVSIPAGWPLWTGTMVAGVLNLGKAVVFIQWSRSELLTRFRKVVAHDRGAPLYRPPPSALPPPVVRTPPPLPAPLGSSSPVEPVASSNARME